MDCLSSCYKILVNSAAKTNSSSFKQHCTFDCIATTNVVRQVASSTPSLINNRLANKYWLILLSNILTRGSHTHSFRYTSTILTQQHTSFTLNSSITAQSICLELFKKYKLHLNHNNALLLFLKLYLTRLNLTLPSRVSRNKSKISRGKQIHFLIHVNTLKCLSLKPKTLSL